MSLRARHRLRHVGVAPDAEFDEDASLPRVANDSLPNVQPIDLSDDEVIGSSPPRVHIPQQVPGARQAVEEILNSRGVRPRTQWLESCLNDLAITRPGFSGLPVPRQAKLCFVQFLLADLNLAGAASLPPAMHSRHGTKLPGPFVLQVDEIVDISHPLRDRYQEKKAGPGRTLKLSLTDGVQRVSGLEYRPIEALQIFSPAGMKVSLKNVCVKRGLIILVPEVLEVLGGNVEVLESARQRAVQVVNKPPRGRRTRQGSVEPSLVEMATQTAWAANPEGSVASAGNNRRPQQPIAQAVSNDGLGTRPSNSVRDTGVHHLAGEDVQQGPDNKNMLYGQPTPSSGHSAHISHFQHFQQSTRSSSVHQLGQLPMQQDRFQFNKLLESQGHTRQVDQHTTVLQHGHGAGYRRESMANTVQERKSSESNRRQSSPMFGRLSLQSRRLVQSKLPIRQQPIQSTDGAYVTSLMDLDNSQENRQNSSAISSNPPSRVDAFQERVPFTYLSVLKDKTKSESEQIGVVRGYVKCVITGVINFQYKDVDEFKLHIHIEDGSHITTAIVQHQLVQSLVGYSPQEVISGLKDPQTHKEVLDNMIRFQKRLERYDGMMEVEFSDTPSVPTVLQMTQGVQLADVMLLLDRVHSLIAMQTADTNKIVTTIDLSTP